MQKQETQQFAKFFLKNLKNKTPKYHDEKTEVSGFNNSGSV
tara:strand:+ start:439 stop:561 length:123 start_codon:yes stop_codon:yes gene_type:complete